MKESYVTAVLELLAAGTAPDEVVKGLKSTLTARRQEGLLLPVLERVVTVLEASDSENVVITVASEKATTELKETVTKAVKSLDADAATQKIVIDPSIIGGSVVQYRSKVVDASYKQALIQLYRSLTTN